MNRSIEQLSNGLPNGAALSPLAQRRTGKEIEAEVSQALVARTHEQGRALLANTAMNNVGALSALEEQLVRAAPLGEARYKLIADGYAMGAAQFLARW